MKKYLIIGASIIVGGGIMVGTYVSANPSRFQVATTCATSAASTSPVYLYGTVATSTITCQVPVLGLGTEALDSAQLMIQFTASSTPGSRVAFWYEYSYDGVDYYPLTEQLTVNSTTTAISVFPHELTFAPGASTTFAYNPTTPRFHTAFEMPTPAPYVRVVFYKPAGSQNFGIWGQILGKVQRVN